MTTVLLHGLGSDRRQPLGIFEPVLRETLGDDELVIAPDVRAHGGFLEVGEPEDFAIERLAAEVASGVREAVAGARAPAAAPGSGNGATGFDPAASAPMTIIGISMGAAIALRIALEGLLPVDRAVFVRPAFDDRSLPDQLRPFPVIGQLLADAGPAGATEFRERAIFHEVEAESRSGARSLLTQFQAPDAARRAMRLVEIPRNRAFEHDAELGQLAARGIRSLVVGAPRDPVHPFALAERWAGALACPLTSLPPRDDGQAAQTAVLRERIGAWLGRR